MTPEQLAVARKHTAFHADKLGYANVDFREGFIEDLHALGVADNSVDLVVSNCVINLSPDKPRVFRELFRVLKPGGELYFSDVFADRRIPAPLAGDPVLLGALYLEDFRRLMAEVGCADIRFASRSRLALRNPEIERKIGFVNFESITVRAFKLALEDLCEDYGQIATYLGTLPECPHAFDLDDHHHFAAGKPMLICGNTADMLGQTRYARHFRVTGDKAVHFGLFDCAPGPSTQNDQGACC
jgi:SAM-dependent methyltransferase